MTTLASILAWRNPWAEEPAGLQSMVDAQLWGVGGGSECRAWSLY